MKSGLALVAVALALAGCGGTRTTGRQPSADKLPALVADASPPPTADADRDAELTRRVRKTLETDATLAPVSRGLTIVTLDGVVTLRGAGGDAEQRRRLGEVARSVPGVRDVRTF